MISWPACHQLRHLPGFATASLRGYSLTPQSSGTGRNATSLWWAVISTCPAPATAPGGQPLTFDVRSIMPTPTIYASVSEAMETWPRRAPRWFWICFLLLMVSPPLLERFVPATGETPGRVLFIFLISYLALLVPYYAFRNYSANWSLKSKWFRAAICTAWVFVCVWFIYAGFFPSE
jgi:hypothetical protein